MTFVRAAETKLIRHGRTWSGHPRLSVERDRFLGKQKGVDARAKCSARRHPRQVFGDIADTANCMEMAGRRPIHALARGVEDGREA
jgi:hypothetical protein